MKKKGDISGLKKEITALRNKLKKIQEEVENINPFSLMFRNIADNSPDMIWAKDLNGQYIFANRTFCEQLLNAKDTEEPVGKDDMFFAKRERDSHPENPDYHTFGEICADSDRITMSKKSPQRFEEFGNVKGKFLFLDVFKAPLWDSKGKMIGTVGSGRDVTEEKMIEERISRSEENYKNIFNITNDAIFIYDKKTRSIIDVNRAAEKIYGYSKEELKKMHAGTLSSGDDSYTEEVAKNLFGKTIKSGHKKFHWLAKRKGGSKFWAEIELRTVVFNGSETLMSIIKDINEQKRAESQRESALKSLRESEERYKTLVENIRDGVIVHSDNKIVYVNQASMEIMGNGEPEEYFIGKSVTDFVHPDSIKEMQERVKLIYRKESNVGLIEEKFIRTDGTIINTEVMASMIDYDGKAASLVVFKDITDRKATEQKLIESETSYRELFDNAIDAIYIQDENGVFLDVNKGALKMYGYPKEFFIGKTPEDLSAPDKNDMEEIKNCVIKAMKGEPQQFEFWGKRKNGEIFPKLVRLSKGKFFGKRVVFAFSIDITDRKKAYREKNLIESQIRHTQKLESLGILAGGIAHDFNNLLTGILGNAGLARMDISPGNPVLKSIKNIETIAVRAADLCNQLLAYSGKGKFEILPVNINIVIQEITKLLETSIPKKIEIKYEFSEEISVIEGDVSQFRQIIMNLILNASDSIGNKQGRIKISTGVSQKIERESGASLFLTENLKDGKFVYLDIADDGKGMDQEVTDRIFDPFFTTKSSGRGLGLSVVIGIVKGHNGIIRIKSKYLKGTEFRIFFPESSKPPVHDFPKNLYPGKWKGEGTILVADDEKTIRVLSRTILEKSGFKVITAVNGKDAVKKFIGNSNEIVLVLLDMTMPKKSGVEAMKVISRIKPGVKAILSSGYNKNGAVQDLHESGFDKFLEKPYLPEKLINIVKEILG